MAGLEPLYAWARPAISRPQDALVCGIHWELIQHGYRCLGTGDEVRAGPRRRGGLGGRGEASAFPGAARRPRAAEPGPGEPGGAGVLGHPDRCGIPGVSVLVWRSERAAVGLSRCWAVPVL